MQPNLDGSKGHCTQRFPGYGHKAGGWFMFPIMVLETTAASMDKANQKLKGNT